MVEQTGWDIARNTSPGANRSLRLKRGLRKRRVRVSPNEGDPPPYVGGYERGIRLVTSAATGGGFGSVSYGIHTARQNWAGWAGLSV